MEKSKKRKNRKGRLLLLLLLFAVTAICLTTSTYAWFTANTTVKVDTISVDVEARNGIQISTDASNWKAVVLNDDITGASSTYVAAKNQLPATMEPVSTIGELDSDHFMKMFYGTIDVSEDEDTEGEYIVTAVAAEQANGTSGKFVAFDLFFKVTGDTNVQITANSGVDTNDENDTGIKNAARIGFVVLGNSSSDSGDSVSTLQALDSDAPDVYIWEPNYDVHTAAAVSHANDVYNETITQTGNASALHYAGVKAPIAKTDNVLMNRNGALAYTTDEDSSAFFAEVTPTYKTTEEFSDFSIFQLKDGVTKVRIYMWIEGQDVDCENSASGGNAIFNLQIAKVAE